MYDMELCEAKLKLWLKIEEDIAVGGQSYEVKGRKLTRVDMSEVREQIKLWEVRLSRAKGSEGVRFGRAVIW